MIEPMDTILRVGKKLIPKSIFEAMQPSYHYMIARLSASYYGHPSRKINVIAITGTKGKSSTSEIVNAILEGAGKKQLLQALFDLKLVIQAGQTSTK